MPPWISPRRSAAAFPIFRWSWGGYHPSILPEETLEEPYVDYVLRDEAELGLAGLCHFIGGREDISLSDIPNLSYRNADGKFAHNPPAPLIDVDTLPWPKYDLLAMDRYSSPAYTLFDKPVFQINAARGCPYKCSFCSQSVKYRKRDVADVVDEIEFLIEKYGARQIHIIDPIFPLGRKHALAFSAEMIKRGVNQKIVWNATTRPEFLTEEIIHALRDAGCKSLGFGIESGVSEILRDINKKSDLDKIRKVCTIAYKAGMVVSATFIIGFPGETEAMTRQTIDYAKSLDIHYVQFSVLTPYPGTEMYNQLKAAGELEDLSVKDYRSYNQNIGNTGYEPAYVPKGRTGDELKAWQRRAYKEFYLRPRMVWMHLPHLRWRTFGIMLKSAFSVLRSLFHR